MEGVAMRAGLQPDRVFGSTRPVLARISVSRLVWLVLGACIWASIAALSACDKQDPDQRPVLVGRILDEDLAPIGSVELDFCSWIGDGGTASSRQESMITSPEGLFWIPLHRETPEGGFRYATIRAAYWNEESVARLGTAEAAMDLTAPLPPGEHDLGDVVLVEPGSSKHLSRLDGNDLIQRYEESLLLSGFNGVVVSRVEACLLEMARRGTERWREFLATELERGRAEEASRVYTLRSQLEVQYLTALRRAQGKRDPLEVIFDPRTKPEAVFPEMPPLICALKNVDDDRESVTLSTRFGTYSTGRSPRCRLEVVSPDGRLLPILPDPDNIRDGGLSFSKPLLPGQTIPFTVMPSKYVKCPSPGTYEVRVLCHHEDDIVDRGTAAGRVVSYSQSITMRLLAKKKRLTRAEVAEMRQWVERIDTSAPVPLVSLHWLPYMSFIDETRGPEDLLFRKGYAAVAVLIDALDGGDPDPQRRAWVLGMLWNITGLHKPTEPENSGVLGSWEWVAKWPTSKGTTTAEVAEPGKHEGQLEVSKQEVLSAMWKALRPCFEMEVVD